MDFILFLCDFGSFCAIEGSRIPQGPHSSSTCKLKLKIVNIISFQFEMGRRGLVMFLTKYTCMRARSHQLI
jgi:hypothetical protein